MLSCKDRYRLLASKKIFPKKDVVVLIGRPMTSLVKRILIVDEDPFYQVLESTGRLLFDRRHQIAKAGTGHDMFRTMGIIFQFLAQACNTHPQDFLVSAIFWTPYTGQ